MGRNYAGMILPGQIYGLSISRCLNVWSALKVQDNCEYGIFWIHVYLWFEGVLALYTIYD